MVELRFKLEKRVATRHGEHVKYLMFAGKRYYNPRRT